MQQTGVRLRIGLSAAALMLLVAGCANQGIWPTEDLPPAPAQQMPFPTFQSRDTETADERGVLTEIERQELEARLTAAAKARERGVERRIESSGK